MGHEGRDGVALTRLGSHPGTRTVMPSVNAASEKRTIRKGGSSIFCRTPGLVGNGQPDLKRRLHGELVHAQCR